MEFAGHGNRDISVLVSAFSVEVALLNHPRVDSNQRLIPANSAKMRV